MRMPLSPSPALFPAMALPSQQRVIPPADRFKFTGLFVLATGVGWFLTGILLQTFRGPLAPGAIAQQGLLATFIMGLVSGLVVSATQWLVLRRYLSDWLWILAGATGYLLLMLTLEAWWGWVGTLSTVPAVATLISGWSPAAIASGSVILRTTLAALAAIWLGVAQWLFLRQYTRACSGWILVPPTAVIISAVFSAAGTQLLALGIQLPLEVSVLAAGILGTTQAIALCTLEKRESSRTGQDRTTPLATAPAIEDYSQIQALAQKLRYRLNLAWTSDHLNQEALMYWVGVTAQGAIAAFQPTHYAAMEQMDQIPLPELLAADQNQWTGTEPLARFEVVFLPSGRLQVHSEQGIPLWWIALSMGITVLAVSAIAALLRGFFPSV